MGKLKMLPTAVRWICLLLLAFQGVTGQLSFGDHSDFLIEDLVPSDVTTQPDDAVGEESPSELATEQSPDNPHLPDLGAALNAETISTLEEEEIVASAAGADFGVKIQNTAPSDAPEVSSPPQLTRRILASGTLPTTPAAPEATPTFTVARASSLIRFLADPNTGWLPNWPSHLMPSSIGLPEPTVIFPPERDEIPAASPVPSIEPTLTVSKVPVTQYYFDITSAVPSPPPGPLFHPEDINLSGSITPEIQHGPIDLSEEIVSSIPELQSSVFIQTTEPVLSTPTLPDPQILPATKTPTNSFTAAPGTTTASSEPTVMPTSVETEIADNDLASEINITTTIVSDIPNEIIPDTRPQPSLNLPSHPEGKDDLGTTVSPLRDSSTEPVAVLSEDPTDPTGTGVAQPESSATSLSPNQSESELAISFSTSPLGSFKPTSLHPSQAANISRTPLWMLLSQSVPSQSLNTEALHTTQTSVVNIPATDSLTTGVPTLSSTVSYSGVVGGEFSDTDLVSSFLISSKLISTNLESSATTVESLAFKTSSESPVSPVVHSSDLVSTSILTEFNHQVSIMPTPTPTEIIVEESTLSSSLLNEPSFDDSEKPIDVDVPSTPVTDGIIESNISVPITTLQPDLKESDEFESILITSPTPNETTENNIPSLIHSTEHQSSLSPQESVIDHPFNATVAYHESSGDTLVVTVPKDDSWPLDPSTFAAGSIPSATQVNGTEWTPIVNGTEKSVDITQIIPSSTLATGILTSSLSLNPPELTGGFIPIVSETSEYDTSLSSVIVPERTNTSSIQSVTDIVASTSAPAESLSTLPESPTLTDLPNVRLSSIINDHVFTSGHHPTGVPPVSHIVSVDGLVSSNLLLPTTPLLESKSEFTSVPLIPSFDVSVTASEPPFSLSVLESEKMANSQPSVIPIDVPSSSSVLITEIPPSTLSIPVPSLTLTEDANSVSPPSVSSSSPSPSESFNLQVTPSSSYSSSAVKPLSSPTLPFPVTPDSPSLITPTVTEEKINVTTAVGIPEEAISPGSEVGEAETKEPPKKATEEVDMGKTKDVQSTEVPEEPTPSPPPIIEPEPLPTLPPTPPPTTTTTAAIPTTTVKEIETKLTEASTSPLPPITTSRIPFNATFTYSESIPSLTTTVTFPNGTVYERPLPYVKALVAYNGKEFCQHKHNFRTMLAEWISQHLQEDGPVIPSEIEFFNMPDCSIRKPSTLEEHINQLPENVGNSALEYEEKLNSSLGNDEEEVTNVYFYITRSGKINSNLTEKFPLFPMELEISEELTYLRTKVSQLELVRPGDSDGIMLTAGEDGYLGTSTIVIIVIVVIVSLIILTALILFMIVKKRGASNNYYGRRCTPVSMDAYSMDSVSVYHSFRRKSKKRASGRSVRSYLNQAFDDPNGPSRPLNFAKLTHFISDIDGVHEEFSTIPVNMPKYDELPAGVEDKNRYANVIPVPETRVLLKCMKDSPNAEYINANYVRGPRNESKYYIATQAPLDETVADFWRMIWEQETRVVVMLTDFVEKGIDKCADYLPPSETLDCHRLYGDFQVTLKSRDMREKFVVSNVQLKNLENNLVREIAHMWFTGWPAAGVPNEESTFISYILDIRRTRKKLRAKGPILVHCSPGTGRAGTFLACDLVMRQFEDQRTVDIPRTVYSIRRDRAGAVQTKEQYAFIYRVINLYASKLTTGNLDSL